MPSASSKHFIPKKIRSTLIVEHFSVGALGCVCTLIGDPASKEAILIDAGAEAELILQRIIRHGFRVRAILHTHAHIDHLGATEEVRQRCGARAAIHSADLPLSRTLDQQARFLGLPPIQHPVFEDMLADRDGIRIGTASITALHTPGHTPGSLSFALEHDAQIKIMTGDTLFAGGVGRWDIGGTSLADIVRSIKQQLFVYPDNTVIVPGHGAHSTIGRERQKNPYLQETSNDRS